MKSQFSKTWKASKQPRKQRKYVYNAPLHILKRFLAATLSKELRGKHGMRNIEVKKGDEVKVMRGKFKGKKGKVGKVDVKNTRVSVDGIQRAKKAGDKVDVWFHPSNLMIMNLNLDDSKRMKRKRKVVKESEEKKDMKVDTKQEKKDAHKTK